MSPVQQVPCFTAVCDGCGTDLMEEATGGEYIGFADRGQVLDSLVDADGVLLEDGAVTACRCCVGEYMAPLDDGTPEGGERRDAAHDQLRQERSTTSEHGRAFVAFLIERQRLQAKSAGSIT